MSDWWIPLPVQGWPEVVEFLRSTGRPWPELMVVADLRWHVDQGVPLPGRPALVSRWGWADRAVRKMLDKPGRWWDPKKGAPPTTREQLDARTPRSVRGRVQPPPASVQPPPASASLGEGQPQESAEDVQPLPASASLRPASVHTRASIPLTGDSDNRQENIPPDPPPSAGGKAVSQKVAWSRELALEVGRSADRPAEVAEEWLTATMGAVDTFEALVRGPRRDLHGTARAQWLATRRATAPEGLRRKDFAAGLQLAAVILQAEIAAGVLPAVREPEPPPEEDVLVEEVPEEVREPGPQPEPEPPRRQAARPATPDELLDAGRLTVEQFAEIRARAELLPEAPRGEGSNWAPNDQHRAAVARHKGRVAARAAEIAAEIRARARLPDPELAASPPTH